jgi:hypothetical protein
MSRETTVDDIINNWTTEPYLHQLMEQCKDTFPIIESLMKINDKNDCLVETYIFGILKPLNNLLLDKYTVDEYRQGVYKLGRNYHKFVVSDEIIIKKHWMKAKHQKKFYNIKNN